MACRLVAYYRVSTTKQGEDGLGMDAQKHAVAQHVATTGCTLVGEYQDVETARKDDLRNRPGLRAAIAHAKRSRATLVIAKLDRLARSVYVTAELHRSGVEFVCCDMPQANRFTINILAAVAELESKMISERTKAGMAAAKARGVRFGNPNLTREGILRGAAAAAITNRRLADEAYQDLAPLVREMHASGAKLDEIAAELNRRGHMTRRQRPWTKVQVLRVLARAQG